MENLTLHQESLRALFRTLLQLMNFYVYSKQQIVPLFSLTDSHDEQEHNYVHTEKVPRHTERQHVDGEPGRSCWHHNCIELDINIFIESNKLTEG